MSNWSPQPEVINPDLLSISLLPSKADGVTLSPYGYLPGWQDNAGYLLDLSEQQQNPPTIIAGDYRTMDSGHNASAKRYRPDTLNPSLDKLAEDYRTKHKPLSSAEGVGSYNELLAQIGHPHVAAIVIPDFDDVLMPTPYYHAFMRLAGSLSALSHMQYGADLPVVVYHVTGAQKGEITYLGEGKEQLREIASQALHEIIRSPKAVQTWRNFYNVPHTEKVLKRELGIDINLDRPRPGMFSCISLAEPYIGPSDNPTR